MLFSSVTFIVFFLPSILSLYAIIYILSHKFQKFFWCNFFLLVASLFFYAWGEPKYTTWLMVSTVLNFSMALILDVIKKSSLRKTVFIMGITLNLGLLCYFKYLNYFIKTTSVLFEIFVPSYTNLSILQDIALPLGISFYTFQGMSYLIDVYRKDVSATKNIVTFGCYLAMFPQLVAGPIVRYITIEQELLFRRISIERVVTGVNRFIIGLAKKVLVADTLSRVSEQAFSIPVDDLSLLAAWAGIICYSFQIYFDFSGYSDMAIGLGHILGFTFPENFNYPYISRSIKEFWRRWHITLSTWFRDYLYIPLGGNRHGSIRTVSNLFIVFILCGFWHGAASVFIVWGLYHGFFLVIERLFPSFPGCFPVYIQRIYTLLVIMLGWVFFKSTDIKNALCYIKKLFSISPPGIKANLVWMHLFSYDVYIMLIVACIGSTPAMRYIKKYWDVYIQSSKLSIAVPAELLRILLILSLFLVCLLPLFGSTHQPFIYFRF